MVWFPLTALAILVVGILLVMREVATHKQKTRR